MTSPVIEPLPTNTSGHENINTGFPFDSDDGHFRTELEDIALRHPEFAEHLNPTQRRANSERFRSQHPFAEYRPTARDWPFGNRFQQFGFPFTPDFDDDPLIQQQQYQAQADERPPQKQEEKVSEKPPPTEERARRPHIQQSNTVDLGQKQEAVDDNRNQRSMSAPPENRNTSNKRFVSSINIPNFNQGAGDNMGGRMSQPDTPPQTQQQQQQQSNKPTERIIPIHIEGRDEPIIPKNVNISASAGAAPKQPQQQPQAERIFGQRPSTFTQFLNRGDLQDVDAEKQMEELARQQQEYQRQQQEYQKQQQQEYQKQQQQQQQQQQEPHKQTPPPEQKPTPLDLIQNIQKDVSKLMEDVAKFEGKPKDKQYLYLDEMLTRNLLKLDNIETEGKDSIRQARKEAIKCIEQCIQVLESKANANELKQKALEEGKPETSLPGDNVEIELKEPEVAQTVEEPAKIEPMEVEQPKPAEEAPKEEVKVEEKEEKPAEVAEQKTASETTDEKNPEKEKPESSEPSQEQPKEDKPEKKKGKKKSESK